jgi:hypothetical protein
MSEIIHDQEFHVIHGEIVREALSQSERVPESDFYRS